MYRQFMICTTIYFHAYIHLISYIFDLNILYEQIFSFSNFSSIQTR